MDKISFKENTKCILYTPHLSNIPICNMQFMHMDLLGNTYKIDMGSNSNIMPLHIFKKLFPGVTNEQLVETINKGILLKTYNKITVT